MKRPNASHMFLVKSACRILQNICENKGGSSQLRGKKGLEVERLPENYGQPKRGLWKMLQMLREIG